MCQVLCNTLGIKWQEGIEIDLSDHIVWQTVENKYINTIACPQYKQCTKQTKIEKQLILTGGLLVGEGAWKIIKRMTLQ